MQKRKAIDNVSASTAIELKAEIAQHIEQFEKVRATHGKQSTAKRPDKKPTVWSRQNKGVQDRNQRDEKQHLEAVESNTLAKSREQLEKKARLYEAMQRGEYDFKIEDVDEDKLPLIDFDRKYLQEREFEERINSKKRRLIEEKKEDEEDADPWVEYVDEFGRTRIVRRSEVPDLKREEIDEGDTDEEDDYDSEAEEKKRISQERLQAADRTDMYHYEADREIRTKGVGFYQFAKDEEERQRQLEKLNKLRAETENARQSAASAASKRQQMLAKNAEKIRARKAVLQAKKKQKLKSGTTSNNNSSSNTDMTSPTNITEDSVNNFLASVRKQLEQ